VIGVTWDEISISLS